MNQRIDETMLVHLLVDDLFRAVQTNQGCFHVSDGETFASKAKFFERVRGRLTHGKEACRKMEAFLRKHGELRQHQRQSLVD